MKISQKSLREIVAVIAVLSLALTPVVPAGWAATATKDNILTASSPVNAVPATTKTSGTTTSTA